MAEEGKSPARPFLSRIKRGDGRPGEFRKWITASWPTLLMLFFIFALALFVRAYFGYPTAHDNGNLMSGGSDSYYWQRIINYSAQTGQQLYHDPLLNFPAGIRNPRPPMFSMSVVVPGVLTQHGFPSLDEALGWILLWTPAFWGALTIIPTYLLGKETFGRRVGLTAAFLLAVMPSHVQRSVLSDADHDSFILFFIVLMLYFLLKAFKLQQSKKWVENWGSFTSIKTGLVDYFMSNKMAVLYAALAGVAYSAVIMTWVGFGYVTVLVLIYYVIQVLLNKVKSLDSMSVTLLMALALGLGFILAFPVYFYQSLIPTRFDIPLYLFLATIVFGGIFVVTRDHPWTITFPAIGVMLVIALLVISVVNQTLFQALITGEGYFSTSKLYSTIAEARAPVFSELALGFGMITFFMSLIGLVWAVMKIPKNTTAQYIFITVWLVEAIFMAMTSARFMFNATPAFALAAGWILIIVVDKLDFNTMRKTVAGASGSYLHIIRKNVKLRHVVGALFLAFMIVLPNVWYSIDAGIPAETKAHLDQEIYNSIPTVLRPSGYSAANGTWYLGAFGYSLPLPSTYFPAAWSWFASQDANITPAAAKPAFMAWWDYGFEAIDAGLHPVVADNFQDGYQIAGNALMAQNESQEIAIFAFDLIQVGLGDKGALGAGITSILERYGVNATEMHDIVLGPGGPIIQKVLSDPTVYGPMAPDLGADNARIVDATVLLTSIGMDKLVSLYSDLVSFTGWDIRYLMVDARMFPSSGTNTGIFYAPAKLSDRRIGSDGSPIDFYDVQAVLSTGETVDIQNLTSQDTIQSYTINYKDMFYDSMFYKAFCGYNGTDVGQAVGIPGAQSSSISNYPAMPGWNLTHFMQVYRTAYYNPYPSNELAQHADAWTAMSYDQAEVLKAAISVGAAPGVVDDSAQTLYSAGATFLEYYEGAYINGTLTTMQGNPVGGVRVTIQDKYGIPHGSTFTDNNGHYSLLGPPGNDTLTFSTGDARNPTLVGTNSIKQMRFNITQDQSMRVHEDLNHDGILDYIITKDFAMNGTNVSGTIFWDLNHDKNYTAGTDQLFVGSQAAAREWFTNQTFNIDTSNGTFETTLPPGLYDFNVLVNGAVMSMGKNVNVSAGGQATVKLPIEPGVITGTALYSNGSVAANTTLRATDLDVNYVYNTTTNSTGGYSFPLLISGNYSIGTNAPGKTVFNTFVVVGANSTVEQNVTLSQLAKIDYTVLNGGSPVAYAAWMLSDLYDPSNTVSGLADQFGRAEIDDAPQGVWSLYATYYSGNAYYAAATLIDTRTADSATGFLSLRPALKVTAAVTNKNGAFVASEFVNFEMPSGARVSIRTGPDGVVTTILPSGTYNITVMGAQTSETFSGTATVSAQQTSFSFVMTGGANVTGTLMMVKDAVAGVSTEDLGRYGNIRITDPSGRAFLARSAIDGSFSVIVPTNVALKVSLGNPGYSKWSTTVQFVQGSTGYVLIARPDNVTVSGVVTNESIGLRGVSVAFLPSSFLGTPVYAVTGPGGAYSASVPPSDYSVVVNQNADLMGAQRYMSSSQQTFLPSGTVQRVDIQVTKRIQMFGSIVGGSTSTSLNFNGPEQKSISVTTLNYSVYLLPGNYDVYATSTVTGVTFANLSSVSLTLAGRQHDLVLTRAYALHGLASVPTKSSSDKTVAVQATSSSGAVVSVTSTSIGSYSLQLPPGNYTVMFSREDYLAIGKFNLFVEYFAQQSVTIGTSDVTLDPGLAIRLDNATLAGTVLGPLGTPEQATISLIPNTYYGEPFTLMTDPNGVFNQSVQPGDYTVYVTNQVDRSAALSRIVLLRGVEAQGNIPLQASGYLNVKAQVAGVGAQVVFTLSNGSSTMQLPTDPQGNAQILLPPANYSLSSTTYRTENTLNITYSISKTVSLGNLSLFETLDFVRGTSRSVVTSWSRSFEQSAAPGQQVNYVFTVSNTGNVADTYLITYTGSGFNVSFSSSSVDVDFGVNNQTTIVAHVTPTTSIAAGEQAVATLVRSANLATLRSNLALYVNVLPLHGVQVKSLNTSATVTSRSTITKFNVTNTGNVPENFTLQIQNEALLESLGWEAVILDPTSGNVTTNVTLQAFSSSNFEVNFTSTRTDADPTAQAIVLAYASNASYVSSTGAIPIILPDLVLPPGSLTATSPNAAYAYNTGPLYTDMGLLVAIAVLAVLFFILRRKKGFGGAKK